MYFLHFVGQGYYDEKGFIAEARKCGVQRKIKLQDLKKINFGDIVFLAFGFRRPKDLKKGLDPAKVFGYFKIEKLSGMEERTLELISKELGVSVEESDNEMISRGCGTYVLGSSLTINVPMEEIKELIRKYEFTANLFVGGTFTKIKPFWLIDYPFARSVLLALDRKKLGRTLADSKNRVLEGRFDIDFKPRNKVGRKNLQAFKEYEKEDIYIASKERKK